MPSEQTCCRRWSRRRWFRAAMVATLSVISIGVLWGTLPTKERTPTFIIAGFSMAPTLRGHCQRMVCQRCNYGGDFPWLPEQPRLPGQPSLPIQRSVSGDGIGKCPQCGDNLERTEEVRPADQVHGMHQNAPIRRGDLVAITLDDQKVVKRVVGVPGDVIDVARLPLSNLQLTNNGQPIQKMPWASDDAFSKPTVLVYRETGEGESRWKRNGQSWWWVYHHINPYRGSVPSRVMDDYAVNLNLSRRLEPADGIRVSGIGAVAGGGLQETIHWRPDITMPSDSLVSETSPIAIRLSDTAPLRDGQPDFRHLEVRRLILYRLRIGDDPLPYPITLTPQEYFVLGDNVPISVDSRQWGAIKRHQIICRVHLSE